ncbi:CBO0543 family protein [Salirhabdus sp. Marseille-P4669]|uniref:CBO0543 family protein n=1 Tax=Salirhabdus sp. Marseille-P4669 TaxID=2042310 RepID=UPI001F42F15D|nr:CBO0543 family protein [Salirhabdus sp. Marseille-P4669]
MSTTTLSTIAYYSAMVIGIFGTIMFLRFDWKRYGLLFSLSAFFAILLCYLFVVFGFYSFPYIPLHQLKLPVYTMIVTFPLGVMIGVRYSPRKWAWKIPFYWGFIHIGVFIEVMIKLHTNLFQFRFQWDIWDSYTWWWIYFLLFEWIGGKIIPNHLRKPIPIKKFHYGQWGWLILHVIVIITIFLAGYYLGKVS